MEEYAASVPDDFVFTVKAPNSITLTHLYKQYTNGKLVENKHFLSIPLLEEFLAKRGLLHVFIQGYYLPEITTIYGPHKKYITGESVIRLHGYDRKKIESLLNE